MGVLDGVFRALGWVNDPFAPDPLGCVDCELVGEVERLRERCGELEATVADRDRLLVSERALSKRLQGQLTAQCNEVARLNREIAWLEEKLVEYRDRARRPATDPGSTVQKVREAHYVTENRQLRAELAALEARVTGHGR